MKLPAYMTELETFPFLTQARSFAALVVMCHHIEYYKSLSGHQSLWSFMFVQAMGPAGVDLFFIISGFLITYLLLKEREKKGSIFVPQFYMRRILRIWPVYYLVTVLGFFVFPSVIDLPAFHSQEMLHWMENFKSNFSSVLALYCLLLPNLVLGFFEPPIGISHLWSLGVEEQFYLFWPWLLKLGKSKAPHLMIVLLALKLVAVIAVVAFKKNASTPADITFGDNLAMVVSQFRIEMMIAGGLAACLFVKRDGLMPKWLSHPLLQGLSLALVATGMAIPNVFVELMLAIGITHLILANISFDRKPGTIGLFTNYLGKISYGIYMYHFMAMLLIMQFLEQSHKNLPGYDFWVYSLTTALTIGISALSYHFFERPFLQLKKKVTILGS